jgi:hypothetical protein
VLRTTVCATSGPAVVSRRKPPFDPGCSDVTASPSSTGACASEARCIALEVRDELGAGHEAVRIPTIIRVARETDAPIRGDQAKAVPMLTPCLPHAASFEHHVRDRRLGEFAAHRESGLASADDDNLDRIAHCAGEGMRPCRWSP